MHVIQGESAVNGGQNATAFSGVEYYMDFMAKSADSKGCKCMKSWRKCRGVTAFYRLNTTWKSCRSADSNLLFMGVEKHCFFMGSKCKWKYFDKNHKSFLIV